MANSFPCTFQGSEDKTDKYSPRVEGNEVGYLDVLPNVRLRVDYAHVRLFGTTVNEHPVVLVQKCVPCVVLEVYVREIPQNL